MGGGVVIERAKTNPECAVMLHLWELQNGGVVIERAKTNPECAVMLHWWELQNGMGGEPNCPAARITGGGKRQGGEGGEGRKLTWNPGTPPSPCRYLYAELDDPSFGARASAVYAMLVAALQVWEGGERNGAGKTKVSGLKQEQFLVFGL